jgi:hypothetical protein
MAKNIAVFGMFTTKDAAEDAIGRLREAGYRNTDISVLMAENVGTKDFSHEKSTKAPEGIAVGAASGAVAGGTLGWLAGIGMLTIPGIGPLLVAGPVVAALAAAGGIGTVGGLLGGLIGLGMPEYEAKRYEGRIKKGGILMSVHCDDAKWADRAKAILKDSGAEGIGSAGEATADFAKGSRPEHRPSARLS